VLDEREVISVDQIALAESGVLVPVDDDGFFETPLVDLDDLAEADIDLLDLESMKAHFMRNRNPNVEFYEAAGMDFTLSDLDLDSSASSECGDLAFSEDEC
jgi:hypothetical protein